MQSAKHAPTCGLLSPAADRRPRLFLILLRLQILRRGYSTLSAERFHLLQTLARGRLRRFVETNIGVKIRLALPAMREVGRE